MSLKQENVSEASPSGSTDESENHANLPETFSIRSSTNPDISNLTVESYDTPADKAGFHQFQWVKDHISSSDRLARSSAPNYNKKDSDQKLCDESIKFLQDNKIEHVISLNSEAENDTIKNKLKDKGIKYTPLPVEDYTAPTLDQLKKGWDEYKKHRGGTLVWCGFGWGRTGTMVSALQIYTEQDQDHPERLSDTDYKKNHVESTEQCEMLNKLQKDLDK
ncbi:protein-tyrosine phosphatase-like protein [Nemania abortiva]|nr:protein-tyrosine phosphatase-like protein [Nemania abortiva]